MVFAMVVIGGITRLTESGLSITEWQPIVGVLPPLSEQAWLEAFAKYQQIPEYQLINHGMTLAEFKSIFWWEYIHRLWGRLIGVVFLVPFLWFVLRGRIHGPLAWKLGGIFVLGGLQGGLGWFMVQSGLVDRVDVSPYRLTAHLGLAVLIYGLMLWIALDLLRPGVVKGTDAEPAAHPGLARGALALSALVFLTMLSGGFVAGLDAGLTYNTFPLMDGRLVPAGYLDLSPWWVNLFENIAAVQFNHRLLGTSVVVAALAFWFAAWRAGISGPARLTVNGVAAMAIVQMSLGISTLLLVVPIPLAAAHQAGALVVFTLALMSAHALRHRAPAAVKPVPVEPRAQRVRTT